MNQFRSYVVREVEPGHFSGEVEQKEVNDLEKEDVLVRVHYSSLNYKDALSASGNRGVTRRFPHTPGIDAAGVVEESKSPSFSKGSEVIVSGFDLGMNHNGGFAEYIRVPADWVVPLPEAMTLKQSMKLGTAGFTAAQCVDALHSHGIVPADGKILVTGATGGVGSISIAILAKMGYQVAAVTGKEESAFLSELGAGEIIGRDRMIAAKKRLLHKEKWAGVIDALGGPYLETALKECRYQGVVAACGNAASAELNLTVYPFILRGVSLIGIDSAKSPVSLRKKIWGKLANQYRVEQLDHLAKVIKLEDLQKHIELMLSGRLKGRVVVDLLER